MADTKSTKKRGFAAMDKEEHRQMCIAAGKKAHRMGKGHQWTADEARAAGSKGGKISRGGRGRVKTAATAATTAPDDAAK